MEKPAKSTKDTPPKPAKVRLKIRTPDGCRIEAATDFMPEANALALYMFWCAGCDPKLLKLKRAKGKK